MRLALNALREKTDVHVVIWWTLRTEYLNFTDNPFRIYLIVDRWVVVQVIFEVPYTLLHETEVSVAVLKIKCTMSVAVLNYCVEIMYDLLNLLGFVARVWVNIAVLKRNRYLFAYAQDSQNMSSRVAQLLMLFKTSCSFDLWCFNLCAVGSNPKLEMTDVYVAFWWTFRTEYFHRKIVPNYFTW